MRFSTVFSVLACGAMAMAAVITPDALVSRSGNDEISTVIGSLGTTVDGVLSLLDVCKGSKCTDSLLGEVVSTVEDTTSDLVGLVGDVTDELANEVADIINKILDKLESHKSSCHGKCGNLAGYDKVDSCISSLLKQLDICVPGILDLVESLLSEVVGLLEDLDLSSLLSLL